MQIKKFEEDIQTILEKFYPCESFVQKGKKGEDEVVFDMTVQIPDRDNEILLVSGARLKDYQKNPILQADHDFSVRATVGSCGRIWKQGDRIRAIPNFASTQFAQDVKTLVMEGHLRSISHTFRGWAYIDNEEDIRNILKENGIKAKAKEIRRIYVDWEPIEISFVVAGSNKEAMIHLAEKGLIKTTSLIDLAQKSPSLEEYIEQRKSGKFDEESEEEIKVFYRDDKLCYLEEKPYKNEHACRLEEPDQYNEIKRKNCEQEHKGKCIDVLYGMKEGKSEIQALRYKTKIWTESDAKAHCKSRKGSFEAAAKSEDKEIEDVINQTFKIDKYAQFLRSSEDKSVQGDKYALGEQGIKGDNVELVAGINETFKTFKTKKEDYKNG